MNKINTWPGWQCVKEIGKGSFGSVYEIKREEYGHVYRSALKVISIPASQNEVNSMKDLGMDNESLTTYYQTTIRNISNEFALMADLKGNSNIVSYEDHMVVPRENEFGWDILIRMELLTPLREYIKTHRFEKEDVVKMGIGMCNALEICQKKGILHRDIKPANIFVNDNGDYKLGDFGVSKNLENTQQATTKVGTYHYMAPEIFKGEKYGHMADLYSLAMVMYQYLNGGALPFIGDSLQVDSALSRRMSGEKIPTPQYGDEHINNIVLKCLSFNPKSRYQSAAEFRKALQDYQKGIDPPVPPIEENYTYCPHCGAKQEEGILYCGKCGKPMKASYIPPTPEPPKNNNAIIFVMIALTLVIAGILGFIIFNNSSSSNEKVLVKEKEENTTSCLAGERYDSELEKCVVIKVDPETACLADGKKWDDDTSTCMTKEELKNKELQKEKTTCNARSDYSWDDATKTCSYDAKKACNAAGKVWDSGTCYTTTEWNNIQQKNSCVASGGVWNSSTNNCDANKPAPSVPSTNHTPGTYYLVCNMKIRSKPSVSSSTLKIINYKEQDSVYISEIAEEKLSGEKKYWGRTEGGWICIEDSTGEYIKKSWN